MNKQTKEKRDIYQIVTNQVIEQLEKGVVPWTLPLSKKGAPKSMTTKKHYRGINPFLLWWEPFDSRYWLTFNQVNKLGGRIRKGEKARFVIYWHWRTHEQIEKLKEKTANPAPCYPIYSTVFNLEQCEGISAPQDDTKTFEHSPIEEAERIIEQMPDAPKIEIRPTGNPCYDPDSDTVRIPSARRFEEAKGYYSVLFHELAHATGHEMRLNRLDSKKNRVFGSPEYSFEELVAEMTATFLCAHCEIENRVEQSAAYINGWLSVFRKDKKILLDAATAAQKAADYILGKGESGGEQKRECPHCMRLAHLENCQHCKVNYCGLCLRFVEWARGKPNLCPGCHDEAIFKN